MKSNKNRRVLRRYHLAVPAAAPFAPLAAQHVFSLITLLAHHSIYVNKDSKYINNKYNSIIYILFTYNTEKRIVKNSLFFSQDDEVELSDEGQARGEQRQVEHRHGLRHAQDPAAEVELRGEVPAAVAQLHVGHVLPKALREEKNYTIRTLYSYYIYFCYTIIFALFTLCEAFSPRLVAASAPY